MWRSVAPQLLGRQIQVALVLLCGQVRTVPPHLFHLRLTAAFRLSAPALRNGSGRLQASMVSSFCRLVTEPWLLVGFVQRKPDSLERNPDPASRSPPHLAPAE
jgi:hypothetical protein